MRHVSSMRQPRSFQARLLPMMPSATRHAMLACQRFSLADSVVKCPNKTEQELYFKYTDLLLLYCRGRGREKNVLEIIFSCCIIVHCDKSQFVQFLVVFLFCNICIQLCLKALLYQVSLSLYGVRMTNHFSRKLYRHFNCLEVLPSILISQSSFLASKRMGIWRLVNGAPLWNVLLRTNASCNLMVRLVFRLGVSSMTGPTQFSLSVLHLIYLLCQEKSAAV